MRHHSCYKVCVCVSSSITGIPLVMQWHLVSYQLFAVVIYAIWLMHASVTDKIQAIHFECKYFLPRYLIGLGELNKALNKQSQTECSYWPKQNAFQYHPIIPSIVHPQASHTQELRFHRMCTSVTPSFPSEYVWLGPQLNTLMLLPLGATQMYPTTPSPPVTLTATYHFGF